MTKGPLEHVCQLAKDQLHEFLVDMQHMSQDWLIVRSCFSIRLQICVLGDLRALSFQPKTDKRRFTFHIFDLFDIDQYGIQRMRMILSRVGC